MSVSGDVLDDYLVWELCKQQGVQEMIMEGSCGSESLKEEVVEKVRKEYREKGYSRGEKIDLLKKLDNNSKYRTGVFEDCSWSKETVSVEDLGTTLPRLGGLPPEVISGSLREVLDFVKNSDSEDYRSVKYIISLKEVPEILDEFPPWVVTPGNRASKLDRMKKVHGDKNWSIEDTWGMINDGNHRTIAKILADGLEEIDCYVGRR
jgi:uncharacterized protein CbrC (UPF0167 family)